MRTGRRDRNPRKSRPWAAAVAHGRSGRRGHCRRRRIPGLALVPRLGPGGDRAWRRCHRRTRNLPSTSRRSATPVSTTVEPKPWSRMRRDIRIFMSSRVSNGRGGWSTVSRPILGRSPSMGFVGGPSRWTSNSSWPAMRMNWSSGSTATAASRRGRWPFPGAACRSPACSKTPIRSPRRRTCGSSPSIVPARRRAFRSLPRRRGRMLKA